MVDKLVSFVCLLVYFVCANADVICEVGFCKTHLQDAANSCPQTAPDCDINNATHYGLRLNSPTLCNCCDYCLPLYGKDDHCSLGGPGVGTTIGRCGHGLTCDPDSSKCVRLKSKCHDDQDAYDSRAARGEVGALERRPFCDVKGLYAGFDCVPTQTCFCTSDEGKRLFGEVLYTGPLQNMPCGCSRFNEQINRLISTKVPFPVPGPRCTSDGNFNPVQCVDRICYCVNRINGENSGDEKINLDKEPISKLSCYDPNFDLFPEIFQGEPPYNYTTPCYRNVEEKAELIEQSERDGFIMDYFNSFDDMECLPDGTTGRIGRNRNGSKICIDELQNRIGNFEANMNTLEYDNMDCKCALTTVLMSSLSERPVCCKNGNFRVIQCYRGFCRCVDSDGRQIGKEEREVNRLHCFTNNWQQC